MSTFNNFLILFFLVAALAYVPGMVTHTMCLAIFEKEFFMVWATGSALILWLLFWPSVGWGDWSSLAFIAFCTSLGAMIGWGVFRLRLPRLKRQCSQLGAHD